MMSRKVVVGGLTAQVAAIAAWAAKEFWRVEIPAEIAMAMAGVLITVVQYFVPDKKP